MLSILMAALLIYALYCGMPGLIARSKGRSFFGFACLSLLLIYMIGPFVGPLVGIVIACLADSRV